MSLKWSKLTLQLAAAVAIGSLLQPVAAFAQDAAPIEGVFDWLVGVLQGNIARSIAIIAVCFLGFMAMTGRLAWPLAFSIVVGIAFVFGASTLVDAIRETASS